MDQLREIFWNSQFLGNLVAGLVVMVVTVTVVASFLRNRESRKSRYIRYRILSRLMETVSGLMISLIEIIGSESERVDFVADPMRQEIEQKKRKSNLEKDTWFHASDQELPGLLRSLIKDNRSELVAALMDAANLESLGRIYEKYSERLEGFIEQLAPFVSEYSSLIAGLGNTVKELKVLLIVTDWVFERKVGTHLFGLQTETRIRFDRKKGSSEGRIGNSVIRISIGPSFGLEELLNTSVSRLINLVDLTDEVIRARQKLQTKLP